MQWEGSDLGNLTLVIKLFCRCVQVSSHCFLHWILYLNHGNYARFRISLTLTKDNWQMPRKKDRELSTTRWASVESWRNVFTKWFFNFSLLFLLRFSFFLCKMFRKIYLLFYLVISPHYPKLISPHSMVRRDRR